jgi:5-enolpyruvylshikimate-3-phosphate synthase
MKIFQIFSPFQQMLEAVTELFNPKTTLSKNLVPVRVKETDRFAMIKARELQRRYNQGNNIL